MRKLFLFVALSLMLSTVYSQQRIVHGKVIAFNEFPVTNIIVSAKKSKATVKTDSLGMFSIACNNKDVLMFNSKSFYNIRRRVNTNVDSVKVNLVFKKGNNEKNEMIAVTYGYMKKEDLSYAISNLQNSENDCLIYSNIYEMIRGRVPGVNIQGGSIIIRGISTYKASNEALLVVDDVIISDISQIAPCDVEMISVLKDSSAASYGVRGANGVVVIKTKAAK